MRAREVISHLTAVAGALAAAAALVEALDAISDRDAVDASRLAYLEELVVCRVEQQRDSRHEGAGE